MSFFPLKQFWNISYGPMKCFHVQITYVFSGLWPTVISQEQVTKGGAVRRLFTYWATHSWSRVIRNKSCNPDNLQSVSTVDMSPKVKGCHVGQHCLYFREDNSCIPASILRSWLSLNTDGCSKQNAFHVHSFYPFNTFLRFGFHSLIRPAL